MFNRFIGGVADVLGLTTKTNRKLQYLVSTNYFHYQNHIIKFKNIFFFISDFYNKISIHSTHALAQLLTFHLISNICLFMYFHF